MYNTDEKEFKKVFPPIEGTGHFSNYEYTCDVQTDADSDNAPCPDFSEYNYWETNTKNL